jgi:hypothetical protein
LAILDIFECNFSLDERRRHDRIRAAPPVG